VISRDAALAALQADEFDVVVIGGGITGAGVALDAATRGYSVALVERADFSSGTSSRSSKLVHGGLRYLQNFDLGLVREALLERGLLTSLASHLVKPLPLVVPAFDEKRPDRMLGAGLHLYDRMSRELRRNAQVDWNPDKHRMIEGDEVLSLVPALAARRPTGGYLFYDCQTDDSRLVLTVLGEAERFGAVVANRLEVRALLHDASGLARGVQAVDALSGDEFEVRAGTVVNATGVWADRISPDEFYDTEDVPHIRPSRGTHVTLAHEKLPMHGGGGAIAPAGKGRTIFILPWLGRTLIGTTDVDYEGGLDHIPPSGDDVDYLLTAANDFFGTSLTAADLSGAYAGVRPLISTGDPKKSVDISRRAELYETSSGMLTITGGKLTTFRRMAKQVVDRLVERDGRDAPCRTHEIPLGMGTTVDELPAVDGIGGDSRAHLVHRYGYFAHEVLALTDGRPELSERIVPDLPDLMAEVLVAARFEQAQSLGDVFLRRTRLGLLAAPAVCGDEVPRRVAGVLGAELGWDEARIDSELSRWHDEAAAEGIALSEVAAR
jgi:glycerol-3-phosphate dehydrogenase